MRKLKLMMVAIFAVLLYVTELNAQASNPTNQQPAPTSPLQMFRQTRGGFGRM